ncbi:MAG: WGR domain-containing protein [Haliscomenobacter sp.]|uniref:WGR domain-containing protein n=1 Tax=Haliscomenobacter sp. TaxID=2717303 RepID=UPI0029B971E4|nr:WGR domain-containing protein [Haliscomenobacter sp.]MDX2068376.1 WGR domain-containing protein [Haliscomenobacter sp.]
MEYLILESCDAGKNRRRRYAIQISGTGVTWSIRTRWGRIGASLKEQTEEVSDEKKLRSRVQSILRKRVRHRYHVCEQSGGFPEVPALGLLAEEKVEVGMQLRFFH